MSSSEIDIEQQLYELVHNLSTGLKVPMPTDPLDIAFVIQCLNSMMPNFCQDWEDISAQKKENHNPEEWRQVFSIIQSVFIGDEEDKLLQDQEDISVEHILQLYEILCEALQKLRQENLKPVYEENISQKKQKSNSNSKSKKKEKKKQTKSPKKQAKKDIKKSSKPENCLKPKVSPKKSQSTKNVQKEIQKKMKKQINPQMKKLEEQVIEKVTKTLDQNHKKKSDPIRQARLRDKQGTQAVAKAKRTLQYTVKEFQKENRQNNGEKQKQKQKQKPDSVDNVYLKMIAHKHKMLNEQVKGQQLRYYIELRDKKIAYIQHIHKLIEKLQKQRMIDQQKQEKEQHAQKKKQLQLKIQNVDNLFKHNIEQLHQNYEKKKKIKNLQNVNELNVCREMEKNVRKQKESEMEKMRNIWEAECRNLQKITGNEEKMKEKLYEIYRKNRV